MMKNVFDVFVVDDEQVVIDSAKKILSLQKLTVDEALDAETALQKLEQNEYHVILTDLMLPAMSGLDLIEICNEKYPHIPIVMVTGYATLENAVQSLRAGAFDFIPKPFDIEELLGVISRAVNFSKVHPESRFSKAKSDDYYFLGKHSWMRLDDDGSATIGVGETFSNTIEDIDEIKFSSIGDEIHQGNSCVRIKTIDESVHTVWTPLSGQVIENNTNVQNDFNLINCDPYFQGWLLRIIPTNLESELVNLTHC